MAKSKQTQAAQAPQTIIHVALNKLLPDIDNARKAIDEKADNEIAASIKTNGVIQPIAVKTFDGNEFDYELIYGHRRLRASKIAGKESIPCIVYDVTNEQALEMQMFENLHRLDLSPMDEAKLFETLLKNESLESIASKIHKSKKYINDRLKLNNLTIEIQQLLDSGSLPLSHAIMLSKLDEAYQAEIIEKIMDVDYGSEDEKPFTTTTLERLKNRIEDDFTLEIENASFDLEAASLVPSAGACSVCPKRTCNQTLLFDDLTEEDRCTDRKCFESKKAAHVEMSIEMAKNEHGKILVGNKSNANGSGYLKVQGKDYKILDAPTKKSTPVVINAVSRWDAKQLGKVVHVELEPKVEKTVDKVVHESWDERQKRLFHENFKPNAEKLVSALKNAETTTIGRIANKVYGSMLEKYSIRELLVIAQLFQLEPYTEIEDVYEFVKTLEDENVYFFELIRALINGINSRELVMIASQIITLARETDVMELDEDDYYPVSISSLLGELLDIDTTKKSKKTRKSK